MDKNEMYTALVKQNLRVKILEKAIAIYVRENVDKEFVWDRDAINWFIKDQDKKD